MREVHAVLQARLDAAVARGERDPMIKQRPARQRRCVYEWWRDASPFSMIWMSMVRM